MDIKYETLQAKISFRESILAFMFEKLTSLSRDPRFAVFFSFCLHLYPLLFSFLPRVLFCDACLFILEPSCKTNLPCGTINIRIWIPSILCNETGGQPAGCLTEHSSFPSYFCVEFARSFHSHMHFSAYLKIYECQRVFICRGWTTYGLWWCFLSVNNAALSMNEV